MIRAIAVVSGAIASLACERLLTANYWVYLPLGVLVYFFVRYAAWAVQERRRLKVEMDTVLAKIARGEDL